MQSDETKQAVEAVAAEEDVLGNIENRTVARNRGHKEELNIINEEDSQVWSAEQHSFHQENLHGRSDEMSDIWELSSHHQHRDWFHH